MKFFILVALVFFAQISFADDEACNPEVIETPRGETPKECETALKTYTSPPYENCATGIWTHGLSSARYGCVKGAMDKVLDKRLLHLKASDKKQFKKEMALQKSFNDAVSKFCEGWGGGSAGAYNVNGCHSSFHEYRFDQASKINSGEGELPELVAKKPHKEFEKFSRDLCGMPASVWKGGKIPQNCAARVMGDMEKRGLFHLPWDD